MSENRFDVSGKRILITGASSGFGAHFARVLAEQGADLVLAARRVEKLEETAGAVRALGRDAVVVPMNVADHASVEAAFDRMPALDVVVNNAGISRDGATDTLSEEDWSAVVDTNLNGVWAVSKFAIQQWRRDGRPGNIINIASILGLRVGAMLAPYTVAKAAVVPDILNPFTDWAKSTVAPVLRDLSPYYHPSEEGDGVRVGSHNGLDPEWPHDDQPTHQHLDTRPKPP